MDRPYFFLPPHFEELPQELDAFDGQHSFSHLDAVVKQFRIRDAELAADSAKAQIASAEHQAADACGHQRSRAHGAGLERDVKGGVLQAIVAGGTAAWCKANISACAVGCSSQSESFAAANDVAGMVNDDRAHRDFASGFRFAR